MDVMHDMACMIWHDYTVLFDMLASQWPTKSVEQKDA